MQRNVREISRVSQEAGVRNLEEELEATTFIKIIIKWYVFLKHCANYFIYFILFSPHSNPIIWMVLSAFHKQSIYNSQKCSYLVKVVGKREA